MSILKGSLQTVVLGGVASDLGVGVDVANIGSNTRSVDDIVEGEVGDMRVFLQQQGQRLTNTTGSTEDSNLGEVGSRGREGTLSGNGAEDTRGSKHVGYEER